MVKLSWRDIAAALLVLLGAAIFIAKLNGFDWPLIESWRSAIVAMGILTAGIFALDVRDMEDANAGTLAEMTVGLIVTALFVVAVVVATKVAFLWFAGGMAVFWLLGLFRHAWHSYAANPDDENWLPTH